MKKATPSGAVTVCDRKNGSEVRVSIEHRQRGPLLAIHHYCMGFDGFTTFQRGSVIIFPNELPGMIAALQFAASELGAVIANPKHKPQLTPRLACAPGLHKECR